MTMKRGLVDQGDKFVKAVSSEDKRDYKVVDRGQLVVGFPIDEAVLAFQELYDEGIVSPAYGVWDLTATDVHRGYLERYLRGPRAIEFYKGKLRGSTARRRSLPASVFLSMPVPVPEESEQRRIAAILDQADELRAKRRRTLALVDELPERIFAERFLAVGRAFSPLGDLAAWQSGGTPSRSQTEFFSGDIPWMTSGELGPVRAKWSNEMLTTEAIARSSAKMIPHGSLLLGMYDTAALKSSISVGRIACNQAVAFGVPLPGVSTEFLYFAVRSQRASVLARRRGARQKNLNLSMIRGIAVPTASAGEQAEFSDVVREVEALRAAAEAHLTHLDELFASLQHRAFTGQL